MSPPAVPDRATAGAGAPVGRRRRGLAALAVVGLLGWMAVAMVTAAVQQTPTIDEPVYVGAGVVYVQQHSLRYNPEHPPLGKLLIGAGAQLGDPHLDPSYAGTQESVGRHLLYESGNDADRLMLLARLPMVVLTLLFGLVVFAFARDIVGAAAGPGIGGLGGLVALAGYALSPDVIAHGSLATLDVPAAGFVLTSVWLVWRARRRPLPHLPLAGAALGAAVATKMSMLAAVPVVLALAAISVWYAARSPGPDRVATAPDLDDATPDRPRDREPGREPSAELGGEPGRDPGGDPGGVAGGVAGGDPGRDLDRESGRDSDGDPGGDPGRGPDGGPGRDSDGDPGRDAGRVSGRHPGGVAGGREVGWVRLLGRCAAGAAGVALVAIVVVWVVYLAVDPRLRWAAPAKVPDLGGLRGLVASGLPFPQPYRDGMRLQFGMEGSYGGFLFGRRYEGSLWYYLPAALLVKTPLGLLVLWSAGVAVSAAVPRLRPAAAYVLVPGAVLLVTSMYGARDLGVRYAIFVPMFLAVAAAGVVALRRRAAMVVTAALVLFVAVSSLRTFPYYLPYSNEAFGGPARTHRHLHDSNVDWGQDLGRLADRLRQRYAGERIWLIYKGSGVPAYYGVHAADPRDVSPEQVTGLLVVSDSAIAKANGRVKALLRGAEPIDEVGHSITIYRRTGTPPA